MRIYDITVPISAGETPTYPGDPGIEIKQWAALERGDAANVTLLSFGAHTATHVDAPAHFIEGAAKVDSLPLDAMIGPARVIEISEDVRAIDAAELARHNLDGASRLLFKTGNSRFWREQSGNFREDFTYIEPDAARVIAQSGVRLVGFDYLSVEQFKSERFETHLELLSHQVIIVEGLDLLHIPPGDYELICLPLKVASGTGDGSPARAVLRTLD
ncbi:MAG TPA: cyclase family protein [Pyrinomonadaceae bacterium]|nr:cyclase family protein [Pyrinomonadaceae bacterium]